MIISQVLDEDQKFRICNAALEYYSLAPVPSQHEFEMWLNSLDELLKIDYIRLGIEKCKVKLNFKRFCLELNDIGMDEFMKKSLAKEDYYIWKKNQLFVR